MMITINLRKHYPWITHDEFVEIPEDIYEAIRAGERQEAAYTRRKYYHKAQYSLDVGDGIENDALHPEPSPEQIYEYKVTMQQLCNALNSLPEIQGRRVDAYYLEGLNYRQIAERESVGPGGVSGSVKIALKKMKAMLE